MASTEITEKTETTAGTVGTGSIDSTVYTGSTLKTCSTNDDCGRGYFCGAEGKCVDTLAADVNKIPDWCRDKTCKVKTLDNIGNVLLFSITP